MIIRHAKKTAPFAIALILAITVAVFLFLAYQSKGNAADVSKFDPGNLMTDATMSNKNSMNVQQIQAFLNSKNACNNTNIHLAQRYPHLQYNIRNGRFVCMAQERFNGKSAAQIIWQVSQDYSINPQVLLVLLEKEQSLVSDTWPNHVQYRTATGFGCPDNLPAGAPPCEAQYFGLENQLRLAANLFRTVLNGGWSNYPVGHTFVQYHPNAACGGSVIHIQNRATSALYRYTPYQPNQAALNAGYGTGDGCSAYGNRNFWAMFTDWFGSTQGSSFVRLDTPRWMEVAQNNTYKVDIFSGGRVGGPLNAERQIRFVDKALRNNHWHLRTEFNHLDKGTYAIPMSHLREIGYSSIQPKFMTFTESGNRSHPASRTSIGDRLVKGTTVRVVDTINIDGNIYYRTEYNSARNQDYGIHSRFLTDGMVPIELDGPRDFCSINNRAAKIDIMSGNTVETIQYPVHIQYKILYNGKWYFQAKNDKGTPHYIPSDTLTDRDCINYLPFEGPRNMMISEDIRRIHPVTKEPYDTLRAGQIIHFSSKIQINGTWYYRTTHNTLNNIDAVVISSAVSSF